MRTRANTEPETPKTRSYLETLARQAKQARENRRHAVPAAEPAPER
ncbi:hypothetical protein [Sinosporangium siamense]|uniref:Uncharacterized protein n=1 Tax=Sinosporangium siamense TaxID=1367973 RepID=A0A919RH17_9ACTN|nr:hypothetical protein [Sinosporangium siamense]GII93592.1 hypothetical protein Ssi02_38230 [Sinosporangium siamense]